MREQRQDVGGSTPLEKTEQTYSIHIVNTALHFHVLHTFTQFPLHIRSSCPSHRLYPCGGVGAGQARGAVAGREGAVRTHVGEAHQGVGDHCDVVGGHQWDVIG